MGKTTVYSALVFTLIGTWIEISRRLGIQTIFAILQTAIFTGLVGMAIGLLVARRKPKIPPVAADGNRLMRYASIGTNIGLIVGAAATPLAESVRIIIPSLVGCLAGAFLWMIRPAADEHQEQI